MNRFDRAQDLALEELEDINRRARLPDPPSAEAEPRDCAYCGDPIPKARLRAVPGALACVPCLEGANRA